MKERPVIFNGEMVRAILDGRKTQTRRVIANVSPDNCIQLQKPTKTKDGIYTHVMDAPGHGLCPFGQVGDRLWVRETWQGPLVDEEHLDDYRANADKFQAPEFCEYAADGGARPEFCDFDDNVRQGWRPSIHMPRWASRITLEITAVRVERLNDISEEDAKAEGVTPSQHIITPPEALYRVGFLKLWQSIYGAESWSANPWVWVIEFRRVGGSDASK
ncbi:hypothetical protein QZP99_10635 [Serratia marcescens]|uniref:phage family protein n=1 Tax=Serratia marcescens TaxID=615 RepID=UPI00044B829B|nr:phage family protein [Serratia marcescens]EZQ69429.1 hypothetical protein AF53_03096 [Serratia marcescens BIDMC 80]MDP8704267.1 hypothetical protein [Serratia marcescens]MDU7466718.1 hypothetical protein [Serratia marcescens]